MMTWCGGPIGSLHNVFGLNTASILLMNNAPNSCRDEDIAGHCQYGVLVHLAACSTNDMLQANRAVVTACIRNISYTQDGG